jgi:hypothetical protein
MRKLKVIFYLEKKKYKQLNPYIFERDEHYFFRALKRYLKAKSENKNFQKKLKLFGNCYFFSFKGLLDILFIKTKQIFFINNFLKICLA